MTKSWEKVIVIAVMLGLLLSIFSFSVLAQEEINFAEGLQKTLYFYDANMCGAGITGGRLDWRGDCHLKDAERPYDAFNNLSESFIEENQDVFDPDEDGLIDLSGGFHDAGDHVKFGLPQSYTASTLGWAYYEFEEAFTETESDEHILDILKHFNDYFLKSTFRDDNGEVLAFAYMVGEGTDDHSYWGPPELQGITEYDSRPVEVATPEEPASDQSANAAASLALMYLNYRDIDEEYAEECLDNAKALYEFAREHRGRGESDGFYDSGGYHDDLSWAAVWLYVATEKMDYIDHIMAEEDGQYTGYISDIIENTDDQWQNIWTHCWDDVWGGVFTKLSCLFPEDELFDYLARWNLEYWSGGEVSHEDSSDENYLEPTPAGYAFLTTWGSARYNAAAQMLALVYQKYHPERTDITDWARGQMEYLMGDNPLELSYIVGYGEDHVEHPHHRAAHGSKTNSMDEPEEHRHTLWGALVGGPDDEDEHVDETSDYIYNEVAIDYNAGAVGALAGHYLLYGQDHEPLDDFPPESPEEEEFYVSSMLEQENEERTQITAEVSNDTVFPPRTVEGITARYFFNISELEADGQDIDDISVEKMYDEHETENEEPADISGPYKWNDDGEYYIELSWMDYDLYGDWELHFGLIAGQNEEWESNWDPDNDWSREEVGEEMELNENIPLYINHEKVYGEEPPAGGEPPEKVELTVDADDSYETVYLNWDEVEEAEGYRLNVETEQPVVAVDDTNLIEDYLDYELEYPPEDNTYKISLEAYNRYGVGVPSETVEIIFRDGSAELEQSEPAGDLGDVNDDGKVDSMDFSRLCQYLLGIEVDINEENADLTENGEIDSQDLARLQNEILGD